MCSKEEVKVLEHSTEEIFRGHFGRRGSKSGASVARQIGSTRCRFGEVISIWNSFMGG